MKEFVGFETALGNEFIVRIRDIKCIKTAQPKDEKKYHIYFESSFAEIDRYTTFDNPIEITEQSWKEISTKLLQEK